MQLQNRSIASCFAFCILHVAFTSCRPFVRSRCDSAPAQSPTRRAQGSNEKPARHHSARARERHCDTSGNPRAGANHSIDCCTCFSSCPRFFPVQFWISLASSDVPDAGLRSDRAGPERSEVARRMDVWECVLRFADAQAVLTAHERGVFDALGDGPATGATVARRVRLPV
jgi:hypothetical protein